MKDRMNWSEIGSLPWASFSGCGSDGLSPTYPDGLLDVESRDSDVEDQDFGTAQLGCS